MLIDLKIKNYALIEQLEMHPSPVLNIITGETGAGKSIMLGAIGLLLGNRADTKLLFNQEQKCVIEGVFDISQYNLQEVFSAEDLDFDNTCILRREISPSGKSRAFVNDTPVTLDVIRKIGENLMDVHSQHDTLQLGDTSYQLNILDIYAGNTSLDIYAGNLSYLKAYSETYRGYKKLESEYKKLEDQLAQSQKELDYNTFLLNEFDEAKLEADEQETLEEELKQLENAEDIKLKLTQAVQSLTESDFNITSALKDTAYLIGQLSQFSSKYDELRTRAESALIELNDIAGELEDAERRTEADPQRTLEVQERLNMIYTLQRKHQVQTIAELLAIQDELANKVGNVLNLDNAIAKTKKEMDAAYQDVLKKAKELSDRRQSSFAKFEQELHNLVADLGMPNARIVIQHKEAQPTATGTDEISILFSANKGAQPQTLVKAASGGEFSRLMLSVKYMLADKTALPTIVFDEIDTGISGEVAVKVGRMMQQMAQKHQIIAISHLPQIAAQGDYHYFVYKEDREDRTISRIKQLNEEERVNEIAHMIAGANPSANAYQSAKELLSL
ncbi:DNA repair protein RecN [Pontibacter sp. BT310]|uniref:DNA repair protein RecN n=1 Tax=Pontibacter populi TaxID=890055 RepID=A0ABS6X6V0_9BACT|nr:MULTISPECIES: DNA repair protein RecN [Pontibacter]MBJ6116877.1 DNA repair protein RecN [Pontibacter sp. BT310]MBR0569299.1 DNA repair protein RecN [Microvirga sp. STS03]MBW3363730.1 DNA repair protein RecN [Pontibacter populi]